MSNASILMAQTQAHQHAVYHRTKSHSDVIPYIIQYRFNDVDYFFRRVAVIDEFRELHWTAQKTAAFRFKTQDDVEEFIDCNLIDKDITIIRTWGG